MKIEITSALYLLAMAQAFLLIFVILRKKNIPYSEKYLVAILFALSLTLLSYVFYQNEFKALFFGELSAIAWHTFSPLLYLYCAALVGENRVWKWKNLLLFPLSFYLLLQLVLFACGIKYGLFLFFESTNSYLLFWIMSYLLNSLFFSLLSIRILQKANLSDKHRSRINWLSLWLKIFSFVLFSLSMLLFYWWNAEYFFQNFEFLLLLLYAAFIFSLVVFSLRFSHYFSMMSNDNYRHTQRSENIMEQQAKSIENYLQKEQPYRQTGFKLKDLSIATGISENEISQVFTQYQKSGFYHIINKYRLEEFERQFLEKGVENYTIMALAELSGFASKATFYKVFKEEHGITPGEYVKQRK